MWYHDMCRRACSPLQQLLLLSSWRLTWPARPSLDRGLLPGSTVGAPQDMAFGLGLLRGDAPGGLMPVAQVGSPPGSSTAFSFPAAPIVRSGSYLMRLVSIGLDQLAFPNAAALSSTTSAGQASSPDAAMGGPVDAAPGDL